MDLHKKFKITTQKKTKVEYFFFRRGAAVDSSCKYCKNILTHQASAEKVVISFTRDVRPFVRKTKTRGNGEVGARRVILNSLDLFRIVIT